MNSSTRAVGVCIIVGMLFAAVALSPAITLLVTIVWSMM